MTNDFSVAGQTSSYDEVFLERYESIYKWGLFITKHNRELTEDLVHEVYVKFTAARQNLAGVDCFDKYLYVALRNSYLSHLKRTNQRHINQLTVVEFDSVDGALPAIDPYNQLLARESLRVVCRYACLRKKTSISASVLILRFFHGYFPNEVALILKSSRNVVDVRLKNARREVAAYHANPDAPAFVSHNSASQWTKNIFRNYQDIIEDLRNTIFAAREGDCLGAERLKKIFQTEGAEVSRRVLSHVVSCPVCLSEVNKLLNLLPLAERHPLDTLSRDVVGRKNVQKARKLSFAATA